MAHDQLRFEELTNTATRLAEVSLDPDKGLHKPFTRINYQNELDKRKFQMPEHLISLYHHPIYSSLTHEQRWRLSLLETINFFSINIHGERKLVQGLEDRLYLLSSLGGEWSVGNYLQHFIHEENAHTHMLAGYCYRYGNGVYKDYSIQINDPTLSVVGQELLFFGRVYVLETFLDYLNSTAMREENIDVTAREIHRFHHIEEARHMAFDRVVIRNCVAKMRELNQADELAVITKLLDEYGRGALMRLYVPKIYKEVGIENPSAVAREAQTEAGRKEVEKAWLATTRKFLCSQKLSCC